MPTTTEIPRQKIPESQKDQEWKEDTVDAIVANSRFGESTRVAGSGLMRKWYKVYNGQIDDEDYTHVTDPYDNKRSNFPAKIQHYPIITPSINLLKGEKRNRPFNYSVVVENPDVSTKKTKEIREEIKSALKQEFVDELNRQGVNTGSLSQARQRQDANQEGQSLREFVEGLEDNYRDERAQLGQKSLNYIENKLEVQDKFTRGFFHFLVGGLTVSEKGVKGGELFYDTLNPINVDYSRSPDQEFIEDGEWAVVRKLSTRSEIVDEFWEDLTDEEIKQIENPEETSTEVTQDTVLFRDDTISEPVGSKRDQLVEVVRVYWKSMRKIGILEYKDRLGQEQKAIVDSDYDPSDGETVTWTWVNQVWKGYRINGDIYKDIEPMEIQRGSIENPSKCKLPINGKAFSNVNSENVSLVGMVYPYQLNYNIYKFRLENAIAKSKGVVAQIDINMIPQDWEVEDWLYYMDAMGIAFVDYSEEGLNPNPQQKQVMDLTVKTIEKYIALLEFIKTEIDSLLGISPQRKGQIGQYEGTGNVQHSITRSSNITEDIFASFGRFEEREIEGLLDFSKKAWAGGKQASFILSDGQQEMLEVEGPEHMMNEYGVFVSDSSEDVKKLRTAEQLAQAMIQNDVPASQALEVIDQDSFSTMKEKIKEAEEQRRKLAQRRQQAERQLRQQELALEEKKIQSELQQERIKGEYDLNEERIKQGNEAVENEMDRELEKERIDLEREELRQENGRAKEPAND